GLCATTKAASDAVTKNCTSMANALNAAANSTAGALKTAASGFAQTAIAVFVAKTNSEYQTNGTPQDMCSAPADFWAAASPEGGGWNWGNLAASGAESRGGLLNLPANSCPRSTISPIYDAMTKACITAIENSSQYTSAVGQNSPQCQKWLSTAANPCTKQIMP